ncbi:Predicted oxidoreductase [Lentzea albidocapillata subsp. violacea]|uniref:Predicted oxidoreductase n=1 Tax=Lentzea albidocapillata subsp. violacea TaxID=128104 RepID=A0A1G9ZE94_9PSEU|nr:aldo/keto reductase [Lentzea albidocapillata]SDN19437.1 Predicted oxidoreductase [Lentzea albidocapillata subsp. violacea]
MPILSTTDLNVSRLCLGGNVFGWTADEAESFAVLDAYTAAGGNFLDTADVYSAWAEGNSGGESETIIGRWLARNDRDQVVVATKVGMLAGFGNQKRDTVLTAAERSLKRLGVDHIDLYYNHLDDPNTPLEETLAAYDQLVRDGKVRYVAASNFSAERLALALEIQEREGFAKFVALQPEYNLVSRDKFEGELQDTAAAHDLATLPYWSLARGFLTGKYRPGVEVQSARAGAASKYLDEHGLQVLEVLDELAETHETTVASVALAWLAQQPTVAAPIASARTLEQLSDLLPLLTLELTQAEVDRLSAI